MVKSFKHKGLEDFFYSGAKKASSLNTLADLKDMDYPGSNLHKLVGDKKGQYAVRVSGNWRLFFEFVDGDAYVVDYEDYH